MYAILAEDNSDIECLSILIKRIANDESITIKGKGFGCCGNLLKKGATQLKFFANSKRISKFIICYDRDKETVKKRYDDVVTKIINPAGIKKQPICILIPTEEIEAWILADLKAVSNVFPSWQPKESFPNPEEIYNPKEKLISLSRDNKNRPRYNYTKDNQRILANVDLIVLKIKCPSFKVLTDFVENDTANYPQQNSKHP